MKVSIIIRTYNAEKTLARAIESALTQDFPTDQFEIVIVDDGSTDGTKQLLEKYPSNSRVVLARQENKGTSEAANYGIRVARGDVIILLDADDELMPDAVSALLAMFQEQSINYVYGDYFEEYDGIKNLVHPKDPFKAPAGAFAWRRESLISEGGFIENTIFPEYDILLRTWERWKGARMQKPVFIYHRSKNSITGNVSRVDDSIRMLKDRYPERSLEIGRIRSYALPI